MVEFTMRCLNVPEPCPGTRVETLDMEAPYPDECRVCGGPAEVIMIEIVGG